MKRLVPVLIVLFLTAAHVGKPVKGDDTAKEQTYVRVFYCFNTRSVLDQRQSGKHKIVLGYSLPSLDPYSSDVKDCTKSGGVMMMGYVQTTPPFADVDEGTTTPK